MKTVFNFIIILSISILIPLISSCEKEEESEIQRKLNLLEGQSYLPLNVGNVWDFIFYEFLIDSTEVINGKEYYRVITKYGASRNIEFWDTIYYRETNDGKVFERDKKSDEFLRFDFSALAGDSWPFWDSYMQSSPENPWYAYLRSKNDTVDLGTHTFYNCHRYYYDFPNFVDEEYGIWLAPKIGFVRMTYQIGIDSLRAVQINGVEIEF